MSFDSDPRSLWRAVLVQATRDAAGVGALSGKQPDLAIEQHRLRYWIRTADFRAVCLYADVDATRARSTIEALLTAPSEDHDALRHLLAYGQHYRKPRTLSHERPFTRKPAPAPRPDDPGNGP